MPLVVVDVLTVIPIVPTTPSTVALMATVPAATAVMRPVAETVAIFGAELAQVTVRPVSGVPLLSFGTAVACVVC